MKMKIIAVSVLLSLPLAVLADPKPGTETRAWIDLQKQPKASSKQARPLPGEAAGKAYDRYLKSFDPPIPEAYSRESFSSGSGNSGSGNSQ